MVRNTKSHLLMFSTLSFIAISCSSTNFNRQTASKKEAAPPEPAVDMHSISMACESGDSNSIVSYSIRAQDKIKVTGKFCPAIAADITVLFVLDQSGSMRTNDPPKADGSCGRSASVKAILDGLTATSSTEGIQYGIVNFSSLANVVTPISNLSSRAISTSSLNRVCGVSGATNYRAAFETASTELSRSSSSRKMIYFITDGLPQYANAPSEDRIDPTAGEDGLRAVEALKAKHNDVIINALYVGAVSDELKAERVNYLTQVTGSQDRVKLVTDANALKDEIRTFAMPRVSLIDNTIRASIFKGNAGLTEESGRLIKLKSFREIDASQIYEFETEDFNVAVPTSGVFSYVFSLEAQDKSGKIQKQKTTLEIKPKA